MVMHSLVVVAVAVAVLEGGVSGYMPHLSPFFFLCNYHGNVQDLGFETGEVTLSVSIVGNPEFYVPGQFYEGDMCVCVRACTHACKRVHVCVCPQAFLLWVTQISMYFVSFMKLVFFMALLATSGSNFRELCCLIFDILLLTLQ